MVAGRRTFLKQAGRLVVTALGSVLGLLAGHRLLSNRQRRYPANAAQFGPRGTRLIRPPGAVEESRFLAGCIRCYRCQDACEPGAIQFFTASAGEHYHTPYVDPAIKACTVCMKCTQVCPTGVLMPMEIEERARVKMATVELETDRCLSYKVKARYNERAANWEVKLTPSLELDAPTAGPDPAAERRGICGECYMFCPVRGKAIEREPGEFFAPLIYPDHCIGCGLCEEICRQIVRGEPAIRVVSTRGEV